LKVAPSHKVLEVGTGSGYQAAVLSELVREVLPVEIVPELARQAEAVLRSLNRTNVHVRAGDGYAGWPEEAPFDRSHRHGRARGNSASLIDQLATEDCWSRRSARRALHSG
jgi:protein-L-isoaspartate(D-aspartate) O-methyltransferase